MEIYEIVVALVILVGLIGIVLPVLPGSILILGAVLVWTVLDGSGTAWLVFAAVTVLLVAGGIIKYAVPGRGLKAAGVPNRTLLVGGVLAVVGFFVIPVVGLIIGFIGGVYLAENQRLGHKDAWPSTKAAVRAVGLAVLIELVAGLLATLVWVSGAVLT